MYDHLHKPSNKTSENVLQQKQANTHSKLTSQTIKNVLSGKPVQRLKVWKHILRRRQSTFLNAIDPAT